MYPDCSNHGREVDFGSILDVCDPSNRAISVLWAHLTRDRGLHGCDAQQVRQVQQVEGGGGELEPLVHAHAAPVLGFAHQTDLLKPADAGLDELSDPEAHRMARMAGGAAIEGRAAVGVVLSDVRGEADFAQRPTHSVV